MSEAASRIVSLRAMREDEYPTFAERNLREYAEEIAANTGIDIEAARAKAERQVGELLPDGLSTADNHFFVIEDRETGGGVGELWMGMREGGMLFGYDFWIRPELRNAGLGRAAMHAAEQVGGELGATTLGLNVFGDNPRAIHLYRSFGFQVSSTNMVKPL